MSIRQAINKGVQRVSTLDVIVDAYESFVSFPNTGRFSFQQRMEYLRAASTN